MEFNSNQLDMAKRLSFGASFFRNCYLTADPSSAKQFTDPYQALIRFVNSYAYERQGAAPAYKKIAEKVIEKIFNQRSISLTSADVSDAWTEYNTMARVEYNGLKVNGKTNPMSDDKGVLWVIERNRILNLASHTKCLIRNRKTLEAHSLIDSIRGVGPKIASLYLRDVAFLGEISEGGIEDQYLLQPYDTWIDQALTILVGATKPKTLKARQQMIVRLCLEAEVSPIAFNQGAWVLGSQIAEDFETFARLVEGKDSRAIIQQHLEEIERYVSEVRKLLQAY
jgi:hypothetical protein